MTNAKIRVESIYDLALAKLLQDKLEKVVLVSPTKDQQEFLSIEDTNQPHDIHIGDLEYRNGIQIKGVSATVDKIEKLFRESLPDSIIFKHPIQQDAVYNATVIKYLYRKRMAILDLDGNQQAIMFNVETNVGNKHTVQVKELTTEKDKLPICSDIITLSGDYVILEVDADFVRVSRKIKADDRTKLHDFGKKVVPDGFGVIIRTSANSVKLDEVENEINKLVEMWAGIEASIGHDDDSTELFGGQKVSEIILGNASKVFLDKLRSEVADTIKNYHYFKAYSMATGLTIDFAQQFIEKVGKEELGLSLENMILSRDYPIGNHVKVQFNYLNGTTDESIIGNISKTGDIIVTKRVLSRSHQHSTPDLILEEGDLMEVHFSYGSWTIHYKFFSSLSGDLIGEKVKIITPLDFIYRGRIRGFDMGMTLQKLSDGTVTSDIDNSVSDMVKRGMISKSLDAKLGEVSRVAMEMLKAGNDSIVIRLDQ